MHYVYILDCAEQKPYTGCTGNFKKDFSAIQTVLSHCFHMFENIPSKQDPTAVQYIESHITNHDGLLFTVLYMESCENSLSYTHEAKDARPDEEGDYRNTGCAVHSGQCH